MRPFFVDRRPVVALVPAFNEAELIASTVTSLLAVPEISGVVVVDDGSEDSTRSEALRAGAAVVGLRGNLGKGGALNTGIAALRARVRGGAIPAPAAVLLADADLGDTAGGLRPLVLAILAGEADLAIGDLPKQAGSGGFGVAMGLARWGISRFGGASVAEPLSGQRAIEWNALSAVYPFARGFGVEMAMTIDALEAGLRVTEVKVDVTHRVTKIDRRGIIHRGRQARAITRELLSRQLAAREPGGVAYEAAWSSFGDHSRR